MKGSLRNRRDELVRYVRDEKRVLIAAHRGAAAGNIVGNTTNAFIAALRQGTDILEIDVSMTTDNRLVTFHDGGERAAFGLEQNIQTLSSSEVADLRFYNCIGAPTDQKVEPLEEVLAALKDDSPLNGEALINLDRGWEYWQEIIELVERLDMAEQIILKSPADRRLLANLAETGSDQLYIPIVRTPEEIELALSFDLNVLGIEIVFASASDKVAQPAILDSVRDSGLLLWGNAIKLNHIDRLADRYDDDTSILIHPDQGWGRLVDMGFDIIQTDWLMLLRHYLMSRGIHVRDLLVQETSVQGPTGRRTLRA